MNSTVFLGKTEAEAIPSFDAWKRKIKGDPHCSQCKGGRGWSGIRTNYNGAHEITGYDLLICCGRQVESDINLVFKELEGIRAEMRQLAGHVGQLSLITRTAETAIIETFTRELEAAGNNFQRSTLRGTLKHLYNRIRGKA